MDAPTIRCPWSSSPRPTGQPLHVLPYCPNWFCTIPLHCSTSIVECTSRYVGMNPLLSVRNKPPLTCRSLCHWLYMEASPYLLLGIKVRQDMPAYLRIVAHIMNTRSLDTQKKKTAQSFGWTLPHNLSHLKISHHNGNERRNNWSKLESNGLQLELFICICTGMQTKTFFFFRHSFIDWWRDQLPVVLLLHISLVTSLLTRLRVHLT